MPVRDESVYHVLPFNDTVSAAAFLAAISRVLDVQPSKERETVVIWVSAAASDGASVVYLNDAALALVTRVFGDPPIGQTMRSDAPPGARIAINSATPPMGLLEAQRVFF